MAMLDPFLSSFVPHLAILPDIITNTKEAKTQIERNNVAIGVCAPVVTIFFLCRVYSRQWVQRVWVLEDWFVLAAWAGVIVYLGLMGAAISKYKPYALYMRQEDAESIFYWLSATSIEQALAILLIKLSILTFYRRIFPSPRWSLLNILTGLLSAILIGFYSSTVLVKILGCIPREKIFHPEVPGTCVNIDVLLNICDAFDVVTDFLILLLPVKIVRELDLGWRKKAGVWAALALGLCAPVFSMIKLVERIRSNGGSFRSWIWSQSEILLWEAAELSVGVACVCVPDVIALCQHCKRNRSKEPPTSGIRMIAIAFLRKLKGDRDIAVYSGSEDMYGSRVSVLSRRGEGEPERQVNGTVRIQDSSWC